MTKYIVYYRLRTGETRYIVRLENKRPYSSLDRRLAFEYETKEMAEFVAYKAYKYSGITWRVMEAEQPDD